VISGTGDMVGWIGGSCAEPLVRREALRAMADGQPRLVRILPEDNIAETDAPGALTVASSCPSGGALEVFVDPQLPRPLLLVVGGSPAARTLVALAARSGFRTWAVHPGAQPRDFPDADRVLPTLDLGGEPLGTDAWAVVATMGHYDEDALESMLAHPGVDVALVASARRAAAVLDNLRRRGVGAETLERIRAPAGGERAGRQEQIALLALAEVVTLRNKHVRAAHAESLAAEVERFATDPVCGMAVDLTTSTRTVTHAGVTVHFCSDGCRERFLEEPQRFLARRS
jgi:xanthine dehydrogenase accessory factor